MGADCGQRMGGGMRTKWGGEELGGQEEEEEGWVDLATIAHASYYPLHFKLSAVSLSLGKL